MQILENCSLFLENLISYKTNAKKEDVPKLAKHIFQNISALGVTAGERIYFTENEKEEKNIEILIPIKGEINEREEYGHKDLFKLVNAVTIRHEGSIADMKKTEEKLEEYIKQKFYDVITPYYYNIIRLDDNPCDCIIDVYVGVNYNRL